MSKRKNITDSTSTLDKLLMRFSDCCYALHDAKMDLATAESCLKSWLIENGRVDMLKIDEKKLTQWIQKGKKLTVQEQIDVSQG